MELLLDLLQKIRQRPEIYLGERSLILLKAFLDGYLVRAYEGNPPFPPNITADFADYIYEKCGVPKGESRYLTSRHYTYYIARQTENDQGAFDLFYQYLDDFLKI